MTNLGIIILAAGKGTRMKSDITKVCHIVGNKTMIEHVVKASVDLKPNNITVVVSKDNIGSIRDVLENNYGNDIRFKIQHEQLGTAHAVTTGIECSQKPNNPSVKKINTKQQTHNNTKKPNTKKPCTDKTNNKTPNTPNNILVLLGDVPLIKPRTLEKISNTKHDAVIIGFKNTDFTNKFGRIVINNNRVNKIVEYLDATEEERLINICNSGMLWIKSDHTHLLYYIKNNNKKKEYYLTDIIQIMVNEGLEIGFLEANVDECMGVNNQEDLTYVNKVIGN